MTILDEINNYKRGEVDSQKRIMPVSELIKFPAFKTVVPSFSEYLISENHSGIIAEHKRMSPSKGIINDRVNLKDVVEGYERAGVSAISVLTDSKFFGGSTNDLISATEIVKVPLLRKDFIIDEYQIYEAKAIGASAILLIAASLTKKEVNDFAKLARELGLEILFEIHNEEELEKISEYVNVVGVNNRDLKTFNVDINQSIKLSALIPEKYIKISESGISSPETVKSLKTYGYRGFLMGENFMKESNPGEACRIFTSLIN